MREDLEIAAATSSQAKRTASGTADLTFPAKQPGLSPLLLLQRTIGNRAVRNLFHKNVGRSMRGGGIAKTLNRGTRLRSQQWKKESTAPEIQRQDEDTNCGPLGHLKVSDIYRLFMTDGYRRALIGPRGKNSAYAKVYHIGDWLNDEMALAEISRDAIAVTVIHCARPELLEADPREIPCANPETTVRAENGKFGPGTVKIAKHCQEVCFQSDDPLKLPSVFTLDAGAGLWVLQDGKGSVTAYPPPDLERLLGVYLQEENCGLPLAPEDKEGLPETIPDEDFDSIYGR